MSIGGASSERFRVLVAGGGVAGLEAVLALHALAADLTDVSVIAPGAELVYRPMTVREPFAYPNASRYPLARIVAGAGARLIADELAWVDPDTQTVHTNAGAEYGYNALVLALGAKAKPHYEHALTIDDRHMDETLHGVIQDIEGGYIHSLAFVSPARMPWQLPLYELALMSAGRAYDMNIELKVTIITPEDSPLAVFGTGASAGVAALLKDANIETITSAYAEIPHQGEIIVNPGDRHIHANRVIALPELYGPGIRGIPLAEHGFIRVDQHAKVHDTQNIYAAGDATDFPIKHGGLSSQQADAAAEAIAAQAGAPITPQPFDPTITGMLLTTDKPLYLTAKIAGGHGYTSQLTTTPTWTPPTKINARYLAPQLDKLDHEQTAS
jgi:sulfide:quinone oxidoreductase